ncbi:hypothetical protein LSUB1_G008342 [Lachnellula subtilissima]|uniref:Endonuclease/exonuclease/phosphatase domain-containing protein n=1 Tax=Lachnellula subtilissima TaxID=602034 RepID=A0A8H8REN2_9HELO|nr:hypothetical protein LSUB1_G008342 [Lachnellula subtilissima]
MRSASTKILQVNLNSAAYNTESALQVAIKLDINIILQLIPPLDSVFYGDFNAHNPWWDLLYKARDIEGIALVDWIDYHDLALLNTPGIGTFHRSYMARPTNINLTLAYRSIANYI